MGKPIQSALIGAKFMGRAHSNAFGQVAKFFDLPRQPVAHTIAARNAEELAPFGPPGAWAAPAAAPSDRHAVRGPHTPMSHAATLDDRRVTSGSWVTRGGSRRRRSKLLLVACGAAAVGALAVWLWSSAGESPGVAPATDPTPLVSETTAELGATDAPQPPTPTARATATVSASVSAPASVKAPPKRAAPPPRETVKPEPSAPPVPPVPPAPSSKPPPPPPVPSKNPTYL